MLSNLQVTYQLPAAAQLLSRLREPRRFIQVVAGPRQVGKTTAVQQVLSALGMPSRYASADEPTLRSGGWLTSQWEAARLEAANSGGPGSVLVLDEIQKLPGWSETVKRLWDEDSRAKLPLKVILLGSAPMLISRGLTESMAGRFELLHFRHWSYPEMKDAFDWSLAQYVFYGGYPGAASLVSEPERWRRYVADSLIETTVARDVLMMTRVDKPALLRRLLDLSCRYSGQILSYSKMLGQLQDAGNTTTLAHYLELLSGAGMARGLQKYAGRVARQRASSPKLQVYNTALISATGDHSFEEAKADSAYWGRLVESTVGAHLANHAASGEIGLFYWREGNDEVDFVVQHGKRLVTLEVKSRSGPTAHAGSAAFARHFRPHRSLLIGAGGVDLEEFLAMPVERWARG